MDDWLPLIFVALMALAMLAYVVLDGYDLGIGILLPGTDDENQDRMVASIGPFWDANETWLVLGVGILLIAFPLAHGIILGALYLPVALMLIGLILRGVAFDFRVKARVEHKRRWNHAFFAGSLLAALSQGYMLGSYILGFQAGTAATLFATFIAVCLAAGYALLGACWTILRAEDTLQQQAIDWARRALWLTGAGIVAGHAVAGAGAAGEPRAVRDLRPAAGKARRARRRLAAVRLRGRPVRAGVHRPRVQPVPIPCR